MSDTVARPNHLPGPWAEPIRRFLLAYLVGHWLVAPVTSLFLARAAGMGGADPHPAAIPVGVWVALACTIAGGLVSAVICAFRADRQSFLRSSLMLTGTSAAVTIAVLCATGRPWHLPLATFVAAAVPFVPLWLQGSPRGRSEPAK